jgi:hypothetical protein
MRKKVPKHKPKSPDTLVKTSNKKDVELTEQELGRVSGGIGGIKGESTLKPHPETIEVEP